MSIPEMMRAAVLVENGKPLVLKDVPVPKPGRGEILVWLEIVGVCHSDLHIKDASVPGFQVPLPIILGHEGAGHVAVLGSDVTNLALGDRVCVPWMHSSCGSCEHCCAGCETVCNQFPPAYTGGTYNGCFAQYVLAKADFVGRIADGLPLDQVGPVACAGITVYKGLKVSEAKPGQWVAIVGAGGGLGHVAIQYAKAMGLKVIGLDCGEEKLEFIRSLGADLALDPRSADYKDQIITKTEGGPHGVIILVPLPSAIKNATEYARKRATIVQIAMPPSDCPVNALVLCSKLLTIRGTLVGTRQDLKEALQFAADGNVRCHVNVRKFSEINAVMEELESGRVRGRLAVDMTK